MKVVTILLVSLGLAAAARENSLKVVNSLRALQPAYRELTLFVVDAVAGGKRNVSDIIDEFQTEVVEVKEKYLRSAIQQEEKILSDVNEQISNIPGCLDSVRQIVENNVLLAGIKFTVCILEIDEKFNQQITKVYSELDGSSASPKNISIFDSFQNKNIFRDPLAIDDLLQQKLEKLQKLPKELIAELQAYVDEFQGQLAPIIGNYNQCLRNNDDLLIDAFSVVSKQLSFYCKDPQEHKENTLKFRPYKD